MWNFVKWNSFSGVAALFPEFQRWAIGKHNVRGNREIQQITAKTGHCPEVDGNRSSIYREVFSAVPRLHSIQPELVISFRAAAHKFRFVRNRIGAMLRHGLNRPNKDN